jgi:hypothetical protein
MDSTQRDDFSPMGNEKGFILPFSIFLTFAILIFTMSAASIFVSRYSYLDTMQSGYQREAIIHYSIGVLLEREEAGKGIILVNDGKVQYEILSQEQILTLILSIEMDNKEYPSISVTYDENKQEIIDWE